MRICLEFEYIKRKSFSSDIYTKICMFKVNSYARPKRHRRRIRYNYIR